jgi:inner membrane protein
VLWLGALSVLTHPTLDFLNNYGIRWLMPFDGSWFYGDALFIIDPWIWMLLAFASLASWWPGRARPPAPRAGWPARAALIAVGVYATAMLTVGRTARPVVRDAFAARGIVLTREPMVAPVLADARQRYVVADDGVRYYVTGYRWWPEGRLTPGARTIARNDTHPAVARAKVLPAARGFLDWARFPFFTVEENGAEYVVTMDDARYAPPDRPSWAAVQVRVPKQVARRAAGD